MAFTKDLGIRDFYNRYKKRERTMNRRPLSYKIYNKLLKEINLKIRDEIIYRSKTVTLPYRLGTLRIIKFEVIYNNDNKSKWRIDYKASEKANKTIYYGAAYGYKWLWNKEVCKVKGKKFYNFKPCRKASRLIADAINNKKLDFYSQY